MYVTKAINTHSKISILYYWNYLLLGLALASSQNFSIYPLTEEAWLKPKCIVATLGVWKLQVPPLASLLWNDLS